MDGQDASSRWTAQEDELLYRAVTELYGQDWKLVARFVRSRTNKACRKRWLHSLSPVLRKSGWSADEDRALLELYAVHGPKWSTIARGIPGRTDDACAKRYRESLDPALKTDPWTDAEDATLTSLVGRLGSKWGDIGQQMSRSSLGCRNRWRLLERRQQHTRANNVAMNAIADVPSLAAVDDLFRDIRFTPPMSDPLTAIRALPPVSPIDDSLHDKQYDSEPEPPSSSHQDAVSSSDLYSAHPSHSTVPDMSFIPHDFTKDQQQFMSPDPWNLPSPFTPHPNPGINNSNQHLTVPHIFIPAQSPPVIPMQFEPTWNNQLLYDPAHSPNFLNTQQLSPPESHHTFINDDSSSAASTPFAHSPLSLTSSPNSSTTPIDLPLTDPSPSGSLLFSHPHHRQTAQSLPSINKKKRRKPPGPARLSQTLPLTEDGSLKPYACGYDPCWSLITSTSKASYATARELLDHTRTVHKDATGCEKPYRCSLPGCSKGWKNINGLLYHLQISTEHFQHAVSSRFSQQHHRSSSAGDDSEAPGPHKLPRSGSGPGSSEESDSDNDASQRSFVCPRPDCFKAYKSGSGLRYHLKHGHRELPIQLNGVPPSLVRELPARTKRMKRKDVPPLPSHSQSQSPAGPHHLPLASSSPASSNTGLAPQFRFGS